MVYQKHWCDYGRNEDWPFFFIETANLKGDPTEIALVVGARQHGFIKQSLDTSYQRVFEIPFNYERKMMTTFHQNEGRLFVMVKGAFESILPLTSFLVCLNLRNNHKSLFSIGLLTNKYLLGSILVGICIQVALVNIPLFNQIFEINNLTLRDWLLVLTLSLLPVIFNELWKAGKRIFEAT